MQLIIADYNHFINNNLCKSVNVQAASGNFLREMKGLGTLPLDYNWTISFYHIWSSKRRIREFTPGLQIAIPIVSSHNIWDHSKDFILDPDFKLEDFEDEGDAEPGDDDEEVDDIPVDLDLWPDPPIEALITQTPESKYVQNIC